MSRLVQGLIELFEKHFATADNSFAKSCTKVFAILVAYLDSYYNPQLNTQVTLNRGEKTKPQLQPSPPTQANVKYFNYYAQIRRDIFEFLLRFRSDKNGRMLLVVRNDRRKRFKSKYLMLGMSSAAESPSCLLNFALILKLVEAAFEKESDWHLLTKLVADVPYLLQDELNLIRSTEFPIQILKFVI